MAEVAVLVYYDWQNQMVKSFKEERSNLQSDGETSIIYVVREHLTTLSIIIT